MPPRKRNGAQPPTPPSSDEAMPQKKLASMSSAESQDGVPVATIRSRPKVTTGKPKRLQRVASMKLGFSGAGLGNSGTVDASFGNFYSPELSTDFLELPQSRAEQWAYYRFFYKNNPFVGQAIDLHTELPLSRIRLNVPNAKDREIALAATRFCESWAARVNLLHRLISIVHEYHLIGVVYIFAEDTNPDIPEELLFENIPTIVEDADGNPHYDREGNPLIENIRRPLESKEEAIAWLKKNYKGWTSIRCLPPEQVMAETFNFTDEKLIELVPDAKTRRIVQQAESGDPRAQRVVASMPADVVKAVREGTNIPLGTNPDAGSFVYCMESKKSDYADKGDSVLARCILPGQRITLLREGHVIDVPVEDVVSTDLLLTHTGRFMPAVGGFRLVDEDVVVVQCDGDGEEDSLALTAEHPILVVRPSGVEEWVDVGAVQVGDVLRESHVKTTQVAEIDLADWWRAKGTVRTARRNRLKTKTPNERDVRILSVTSSTDGLTVQFEHDQDDGGRLPFVERIGRFIGWLESLVEPITLSRIDVANAVGISPTDVSNYTRRLVQEGLLRTESHAAGRGRQTTWWPMTQNTQPPGAMVRRRESSPTSRIPLTEDNLYLFGAWFGDGYTWSAREDYLNTTHVGWSCGDEEVRTRIATTARNLGEVRTGHLFGGKREGITQVWINDALLARWFHDEFGSDASTKQIPLWLFGLSDDLILAFLRGLLDTDGSLRVNDRASVIDVVLDNQNLIRQIHLLCSRVRIHTTVSRYEKGAREWTRTWEIAGGHRTRTYNYDPKTYWRILCCRHSNVRRWAVGSVKGSRITWSEHTMDWGSRFTTDGWLTRRVNSINRVRYKGPVYSFDVMEDQSLVCSNKVVHNCLRTLVHWDKLRQANASIASRHMTPHRVVWAEDMDAADTDALREQVDMSLQDPDFSIIANFQINWEEMGSDQRLLDLTSEMEMANRELYAGLGVTEGLLTGESSYSGDKISLEVINTRYMLLRELLQDFVGEYLFKPMCRRMGFIEEDEDGNEQVIYPKLSFTRLALRDNQETFDALFNLYQKGSLDIDVILELLNIDPVATREKIERDLFSVNDPLFNEVLRGIYGEVGRTLGDPEKSDAAQKIAEAIGVKFNRPKPPGRFDPNAG